MNKELEVKNKPNRLNDLLSFYKSYFMDYWEIKYKLLKYEIDNFETQKQKLVKISGFDAIPNYEKKYLSLLKLDLHFMKFQLIESLFSFIFALENRDDMFIWFNLSFPRDVSNRRNFPYDKINEISFYGRMKQYMKEEKDDLIPYWKYLFFFKVDTSQYEKDFNSIRQNISELLFQLSRQLKDRDDYNAYKHSMRCIPYSNLICSVSYDSFKTMLPVDFAKDGLDILSTNEKFGDIWISVFSKSYSIKEDSFYIEKCLKLMKNIINTRISHFFNEDLKELYFFEDIEKKFHNENSLISQSISITSINNIYSIGLEAVQNGDFKLAVFYFEKVLQIKKDHYNSIFKMGYCHYMLEEYEKAINYCENYEKNGQAEYYIENLYNLALCYYKNGDFEDSDKFFRKFIEKCEEEEDPKLIEAKYLWVNSKLKLNQEYFNEHKKNNSKYINPAEKILARIDDTDFKYPEIWYNMAFIEFYMKRYDKSKEKLKKILTQYPNHKDSIYYLAMIYCIEDKFEKSEELLLKSQQIDKEYFYTWNGIVILKKKQGILNEYYEECKNSLKYSNNNEQKKVAFNNLGDYYYSIEEYEKSSEFFQKSLEIDESFENAISGLIDSLWKIKKFNRIIEFTDNLDYNLSNAINLKFRVYAFSEIGECDKALQIVDQLIPIIKTNIKLLADFYDTKGDIYNKKGEFERATEFYQKTLDKCESEYDFIAETRKKLKECRSQLNEQ